MQRSAQWLVCAAILIAGGAALSVFGYLVGGGFLAGVLLIATGFGAVLVSNRFRKLERTVSVQQLNRQMDRFG